MMKDYISDKELVKEHFQMKMKDVAKALEIMPASLSRAIRLAKTEGDNYLTPMRVSMIMKYLEESGEYNTVLRILNVADGRYESLASNKGHMRDLHLESFVSEDNATSIWFFNPIYNFVPEVPSNKGVEYHFVWFGDLMREQSLVDFFSLQEIEGAICHHYVVFGEGKDRVMEEILTKDRVTMVNEAFRSFLIHSGLVMGVNVCTKLYIPKDVDLATGNTIILDALNDGNAVISGQMSFWMTNQQARALAGIVGAIK